MSQQWQVGGSGMSGVTRYDWRDGEYKAAPGTEDFIEVADLGDGGGYDWTTFKAFYSPSARRYFWHGTSGCSCSSWEDDIESAASFEDGDKAALIRAWEAFAKDRPYSIMTGDYINGLSELNNFKEPK